MKPHYLVAMGLLMLGAGCGKTGNDTRPAPTPPASYSFNTLTVNGVFNGFNYTSVNYTPVIRLNFTAKLNRTSVAGNIVFKDNSGGVVAYTTGFENNDSTVIIQPAQALRPLNKYNITVSQQLQSAPGGYLQSGITVNLQTKIDSTRKFPLISDDSLLTLVQRQTFIYFWDFAHPASGLARERNTSGDVVTSGGSGFGIMTIPVAVNRQFITRAQGLTRMQQIVGFLKNTAQKFHGAFPHWLNGATGVVVPFSAKDNGADLVETSYLMQGLLCARQYFNGSDAAETALRADINTLWNNVEWSWFQQNNQNVLYWHWSPTDAWIMNMPIRGWNEALITYVLAASSNTYAIPKTVYDAGWAGAANFKNGNTYYNYNLPLGPSMGGPLFFEHYSFLGINPNGLTDAYADYTIQTRNHTLINYNYCKANLKNQVGYSDSCWGLTASDIPNGYTASSPTNDAGVIAPTAALSSFPYTPKESMQALKFFYYVLGDKIWGTYGFTDAFSLNDGWFASSYLAIDQGPIVVMIENYRTGLLWNLFTSCPEIKTGMKALGFQAAYL
ncbi:hypothetical protein CLV53_105151 [Sediminibacterium magnilacihabitans]|jgi:hypothetical protein|nr:hypothetical protein CLV53_105151 [Sediminibacterium magnilacihabitans]